MMPKIWFSYELFTKFTRKKIVVLQIIHTSWSSSYNQKTATFWDNFHVVLEISFICQQLKIYHSFSGTLFKKKDGSNPHFIVNRCNRCQEILVEHLPQKVQKFFFSYAVLNPSAGFLFSSIACMVCLSLRDVGDLLVLVNYYWQGQAIGTEFPCL